MKVKVLFFAQFREQLGCSELAVELPQSACVADLCGLLADKGENWHRLFSQPDLSLQVAINQTMGAFSSQLNDGAEVAFFPPVTGG